MNADTKVPSQHNFSSNILFSGNKVLRLQSSKGIIFIVNDICFVFGGTIRRRIALDYNCNLISE